jgi:hypothetical protein
LKSIHDLGDASKLEDLPAEYAEQVVSTRVRVGRTVKGYPMASKLTREVLIELKNSYLKANLMNLVFSNAWTWNQE